MLVNSHHAVFLSLTFASLFLGPTAAVPEGAPDTDPPAAAIDELVSSYHRLGRFSGVVLAARDGEELFARGYGFADREHGVPNTPDTRFRIGSLTKQFTAAAILQLEAAGELRVEDPLVRHLPGYPRPQGEQVTIHHLLSHSSGIPSLFRRGDGLEDVTGVRESIALPDLLDVFSGRELLFSPGDRYRYSNSAFTVAAAVIEKVSGQSWQRYLEERVFAPAGLGDTGIYEPERIVPRLAEGYQGYEPEVRRPLEGHPSWGVGAGGVYTTALDLLRWDRLLYGDAVLPSPQREKLFAHHVDWRDDGFYAYGWWGFEVLGRRVLNHGGTIDGFVCEMYRVPSERLTIIVLANHVPRIGVNVPSVIAEQVMALLLDETMPEAPPPDPVTLAPGLADHLAGTYELPGDRRLVVTSEEGGLWATAEGAEPWTIFTTRRSDRLDRDSPEVQRATAFVEALRDRRFADIVEGLFPKWREEATLESFREPWDKWRQRWGELIDFAPVEATTRRLTSVTLLLRFEHRLVSLEVVLDEELQYAGWWQSPEIPQARVELRQAADGSFFADGFRWRLDDVRVHFEARASGPEAFALDLD